MNWLNIIINLAASILTRRNTDDDTPSGAGGDSSQNNNSNEIESQSLSSAVKPDFDESRIDQDYSVTQKWHSGWKRSLDDITEVVIHHTDGTGNSEA